jgi:hypothetical protein
VAKPFFVKIVPVGFEKSKEHINEELGIFVGRKMAENSDEDRGVLLLGKTSQVYWSLCSGLKRRY